MWLKLTRSLNCWRIRLRKHSSTQALEAKKHLPSGSKDSGAWPKLKRTWRWTAFILQCFPMTHFHLHPHPLTSPFFSWKYPCQCRQDVVWSTLQLPLLAPSSVIQPVPQSPAKTKSKPHSKSCCPYRYSQDHLNYWEEFKKPNNDEIATWLKNGRQGHKWRHKIALKHPWALRNLMSVQETTLVYAGSLLLKVYLDRLDSFQRVMPKGGNLLNNVNRMMETRHTSSWRGTERNILGHGAVAQPQPSGNSTLSDRPSFYWGNQQLIGVPEDITTMAIQEAPDIWHGRGPGSHQTHGPKNFWELSLAPVDQAQPLLLIRSDMPQLIQSLFQDHRADLVPPPLSWAAHFKDQLILFVFHLDSRSAYMRPS